MAGNKYLISDKSMLLKNKLNKLSNKLQTGLKSSSFVTQEQFIFETAKVLKSFYKDLHNPQIQIPDIKADSLPYPDLYNDLWNQLLDDLTIIFSELENIEDLTVSNFNFMITEANRLTSRLKSVSSKLDDYILYTLSTTKNTFFIKDSFNNLDKIDIDSSLLNAEQNNINQVEGIITLPVDKGQDPLIVIKEIPQINPDSNGIMGNNQELNKNYNGDISVILDDNPDTWFEYERVTKSSIDDGTPLILDLTLNLGEPKVINHIQINPNNFGTKTTISIDSIDTSINGEVYTSVKDDIPIAGFITEDEENIFSLAPSTSKFAGQGLYTFTPRKVKYIHIVLSQDEPYIIQTSRGNRLRYAIGIRDINVKAYKYQPEGEIVSKRVESSKEIHKAILQSNQNPSEVSELASIDHYLSPDDGATWYQIQPKEFTGPVGLISIPEILEFNGVSRDTIETSIPVKSLRYKANLTRNDSSFKSGSSALRKTIANTTELHAIATTAPFNIELKNAPVKDSISVVDPSFGSRGIPESPYIIGHTSNQLDQRKYYLPFKNFNRPVEKVYANSKYHTIIQSADDYMNLIVGGETWTHITQAWSNYGSTDKVYHFNPHTGELQFGDGTNGKTPATNMPIFLYMEAENLSPTTKNEEHIAKLDFPTSSNKNDITIKRYDKIEYTTEILQRKATIIRLKHKYIQDVSDITTAMIAAGYSNKVSFLNGVDELSSVLDWSINTDEGIIYTQSPTSSTSDITVNYSYQPIYELSDNDWDWATQDTLRDSISIKDSGWQTISVKDESVLMESGATSIDLSKLSIVEKTIIFDLTDAADDPVDQDDSPFQKEVPFKDGVEELGLSIKKTKEALGTTNAGSVKTFTLNESIISNTNYVVQFTKTSVFQTNVSPSTPSSDGQYKIDRSANTISIYTTSAVDAGEIIYFYTNQQGLQGGLYSVDYKNGRVYTQTGMDATWNLSVNYQYTDFRAEYKVARLLSQEKFNVDILNKTITIDSSEILDKQSIPREGLNSDDFHYMVNYDYVSETREDIQDLKDYFSPILKDYMIKYLIRGSLV